jgi:AcrR family transcriptional regulator
MSKTREKILQTALKLFNMNGLSQVTIRQIAMEMGISSGNLNYHFKKKEEIIEALYFEMVAVFDERVDTLNADVFTLPYVYQEMKKSMERMVAYKFIWIDIYHLLRAFPRINKHFLEVWHKRKAGSILLYSKLAQDGIMRPEKFEGEFEQLATRMINLSDGWLNATVLYGKKVTKKILEENLGLLFGLLFPYLTEEGEGVFGGVL